VEPLNLAGGESAWLLLDGQSLEVGRVQNGTLVWQRLCACESLYAKSDPEELSARLARDLDGDGADEVLLPTATGLEVYRTLRWGTGDAAPIALAPVARLLWEPDGKPLAPAPKVPQPAAPELIGSEAGGARRLLRMIPGGFTALRLPARDTLPAEIQLDAAARARATAATLSPRGLEALARVPDGAFKDGNALVAALARVDPGGAIAADLPALTISLEGKWPETEPERVAFPDLDAGPDDRGYVLALEDLTGDGIPDLVFGLVRNESQILKIESELRFYPGTGRAALAFGTPQVLKFHGPAVGAVLRNPAPHSSPPRDGAAGRVLLVARTDV
jgi:hypothetical protein